MKNIKFYSNAQEFEFLRLRIQKILLRVCGKGVVVNGEDVEKLEKKISEMTGRRYALAVNSCTDALFLSLLTLGIGEGDEVLVTDFSFVASASCIVRAGAKPIFVDIDEEDFSMNLDLAQKKITRKTKAIIFVNLFGKFGNKRKAENFAKKNDIFLIEDAAQSFGSSRGMDLAGSMGEISCISFGSTKPLSSPGSGGMVLTDKRKYYENIKSLRYHGKTPDGGFDNCGLFSLMPTFTAAFLLEKIKFFNKWNKKRQEIANFYIDSLKELGDDLILPKKVKDNSHIYHKFVVRYDRRDDLIQKLDGKIPIQIHYKRPLHREGIFGKNKFADSDFPVSLKVARTIFSIPIHPFLNKKELKYIVESIKHGLSQVKGS